MRPGRGVEEHSVRVEGRPKGLLERTEETLPAQVAIKQPRTLLAESLRFPEQGQSAQGQSDPSEAERRSRWTTGQHSCTSFRDQDRWGDAGG